MGCPRHLKWSLVKGESVALSPRWGLKGKRYRKGGGSCFSASSSFPCTLSLRVWFLLTISWIGRMYWKVFFEWVV